MTKATIISVGAVDDDRQKHLRWRRGWRIAAVAWFVASVLAIYTVPEGEEWQHLPLVIFGLAIASFNSATRHTGWIEADDEQRERWELVTRAAQPLVERGTVRFGDVEGVMRDDLR